MRQDLREKSSRVQQPDHLTCRDPDARAAERHSLSLDVGRLETHQTRTVYRDLLLVMVPAGGGQVEPVVRLAITLAAPAGEKRKRSAGWAVATTP